MRIILSFVLYIFLVTAVSAQYWQKYLPEDKLKNGTITLTDYQDAFQKYVKQYGADQYGYYYRGNKKHRLPGWKQFKRWEWYMEGEVDAGTQAFPKTDAWTEWNNYLRKNSQASRSMYGDWVSLGPDETPGGYHGLGRLNCIAYHPTDPNTFWVGAATGGIWKTTDYGTTWTALGDDIEIMGVSDIIIPDDYDVSQTIYIATGDRDKWEGRSIGVLKSTNGGLTWNKTDLSFDRWDYEYVTRLLKHPDNDAIIYAATYGGVYKTTDGGDNFNLISTHFFREMEMHPTKPDTIYGAATKNSTEDSRIYRSTNGGTTWGLWYTFTNGVRTELAVSPDEPEWVYAISSDSLGGLNGIYRFDGTSWSQRYDGELAGHNIMGWNCDGTGEGGQGGYDICIAVNPTNGQEVYIGGINTWKSTDGGTSWDIINVWTGDCEAGIPTVHADKHNLVFRPGTTDLYECNDGGLYKSTDLGSSWTDLSNGLVIGQIYRLSTAQTVPQEILTGYQDVGSKLLSGGVWDDVGGGDGMHNLINPLDKNNQFCSIQNGKGIHRTSNHWVNETDIRPYIPDTNAGDWLTPFMLDPNDPNTLFVGLNDLWKSTSQGDTGTFVKVHDFPGIDENIRLMDIAPSNSSRMAIAHKSHLWRSINGGITWLEITNNVPFPLNLGHLIRDITYKHDDDDTFWITCGSYNEHGVYETNDGGTTWNNISDGLPHVPVECIVENTLQTAYTELYCATAMGVFVKIGNQPWLPFINNLPLVHCKWLDINYNGPNSKLRAGTWGRGVWESDLFTLGSGELNVWTGIASNDWWDINNWNYYTVPDVNSYVAIPDGCPNYPLVTGAWVEIKELTVYSGASLSIGPVLFTVAENANIYGTLAMTNNSAALTVKKDLTWFAGSAADIQAPNTSFRVERNWIFNSGCVIDLAEGTVFMGGGDYNSEIFINSPSCSFHNLTLDKSSFMIVTCSSTYSLNKLKVLGDFTIFPNNTFIYDSPAQFFLPGSFTNYGSFEFVNGSLKYAGGSTTIAGNSYCYFNDLIIDGNSSTYLTLDFDAIITGDLDIINGSLDLLSHDLYISGNWNNQEGPDGFIENTSNVIFKGSDWQVVSGNENFYTLTLHTTGPGISVQNGTIECQEYNWTTGTLEVTAGGTFIAQDLVDQGIKGNFNLTTGGNIELHSSTWVHLKGNVTISGGSFDVYGGLVHSAWPSDGDASLTMSGGEFTFHDQGIYMHDNSTDILTVDMTEGTVRTGGYFIVETSEFDPSGGSVEMIGDNSASINIASGISLQGLIINKSNAAGQSAMNPSVKIQDTLQLERGMPVQWRKSLAATGNLSGLVTLDSDLDILGSLTVENGDFDIGAYTVDVGQYINVLGTLIMNDPSGQLNGEKDVLWFSGSDANVTDGAMTFKGDWTFYDGTNAQLSGDNVVQAIGTSAQTVTCDDDNAQFRHLAINNTTDVVDVSSHNKAVRVSGNLVIYDNADLQVADSIWVGTALNIQDLATVTVDGGDLHCNNWMLLHGTLNVFSNRARVMQNFTFGSTGVLNIDGGQLYLDMPYSASLIEFPGTTNISSSSSMLHVTNEGVLIDSDSDFNLTSGSLRVGYRLKAIDPGCFQPTGGQVFMRGENTGYIEVSNGNYLPQVYINKQPAGTACIAQDAIVVQGDLNIPNGNLIMQNQLLQINGDLHIWEEGLLSPGNTGVVEISGNWNNEVGDAGFSESTSTVEFVGTNPPLIQNTETFYDLIINKTLGPGEYVLLNVDDTITVLNNLQIQNGALKLQQDCHLNLKNLDISNGAGLIVDPSQPGVKIVIEGNWNNANSGFTDNVGFNHQLSEVTFAGNSSQSLISTGGEEFYRLFLDKIGGKFEPENNITIKDSCCVVDGIWGYGTSNLNYYFYGDLEILNDGLWSDSTCRLLFVGAEEQWLKNHMFWDLKIWDLYVDQPIGDPDSKLMVKGDIKCKNWTYIPEGRMQLNEGTFIVDERIQVNTGGMLTGLPGTTIQMADNSHIFPNGGDIIMIGTEANPCTITNQGSGYYNFNIVNGGYFEATWTTVEYLVASGVHFYNGGIADTNTGFQHCTFQNGASGGTLLQFSTDQEVEFYNVQFPDTPLSGNYNVTKLNDAGNISFLPAYGTFAGENYENDPYSRITWDLGIEWTGAVSSDWHTAGNWVNDKIPTSSTDVLIPDGTPNDPNIGTDHAVTNSLFLESNTTLTLSSSYDIILYEDAEIWGTIAFSGNEDFTTQGNLIFRTGSSVSASSSCDIKIYGDMIIEAGSNLDITGGYTEFQGSETSRLICQEDSAAVWALRINKSGGAPFYFDASSTGDLFINSFFYNMSGNIIYGDSPEKVYLNRSYINNGGNLYSDHTHFIFSGNAGIMPCKMSPGDYYNDLTIQSTSHLDVDLTYSDTMHIKGDLLLASNPSGSSGINANGAYMLLEGNWINNIGSSAFVHGNNTVEFYHDEDPLFIKGENNFYGLIDNTEGLSSLSIYEYNEVERDFDIRHFVTLTDELYVNYSLRLQDPSANLVLSSGSYTEVNSLSQGGTITCNNGFFSVSDIRDDYLIGTYIINGGDIEIHQDASHWVDLGADITITDGYMDIYGGSGISKWPAQVNGTHPTLTMSGGQLYIASHGIEIEANSPNYTITENITGGKIRTNGDFYCRGVDTKFSPSGGEVEITGNENTRCEVYDTGNILWSLITSKNPGYAVKNTRELNIANSLIIFRGEFHDMGNPMHIGH